MDKNTYRKYLLSKIDCAQREVELYKGLFSEITEGEAVAEKTTEEATTVRAAKKAAKPAPAPVVEEAEVEAEDDFLNEETEESAAPEITLADVKTAVSTFAKKHGKEKTLKFLAKWKVTALNDLKKSDYPTVVELAQKHSK